MSSTNCSLETKQKDLLAAKRSLELCRLHCLQLQTQRDQTRLDREKLAEREKELERQLAQEAARRSDFENLVRNLKGDIDTQTTSHIDGLKSRIGELEATASALKDEVRELEKVRATNNRVMCRKIAVDARAEIVGIPFRELVKRRSRMFAKVITTPSVQPPSVSASTNRETPSTTLVHRVTQKKLVLAVQKKPNEAEVRLQLKRAAQLLVKTEKQPHQQTKADESG